MADLGIGTAFPGSPSPGDVFTRSDLGGAQFVYLGGSWQQEGATDGPRFSVDAFGGLTLAIPAGTATNTVVKAEAGTLKRIEVTTAGTNRLLAFDNAAAASGTIIGDIPANAAEGTVTDFEMPAAHGIVVQGNANNPAVTISFE